MEYIAVGLAVINAVLPMQYINEHLKIFKVREDNPVSVNYYDADADLDTVQFFLKKKNSNKIIILFYYLRIMTE